MFSLSSKNTNTRKKIVLEEGIRERAGEEKKENIRHVISRKRKKLLINAD